MAKFSIKRAITRRPQGYKVNNVIVKEPIYIEPTIVAEDDKIVNEENNIIKENVNDMTTAEKIIQASNILDDMPIKAKRTKRDKGLIERTESSTIILTEDNKELLRD